MSKKMLNEAVDLTVSVSEGLSLLKCLYAEQEQRKHVITTEFIIKDYLQYIETEDYHSILASDKTLIDYAAKLFNTDIKQLTLKHKSNISNHCAEVVFEIDGSENTFYIKQAWEGAIKEGIGLEFNNLLTDIPIKYLCSSEIVITEKVFDALSPKQVYDLRDTSEYLFAFGVWEIFTSLLHLTDRKTSNIRWNGERLVNIDFGLVFYRGKLVFDSRFTITENSESRHQGQIHALSWVLDKIKQPKVQQLLLNLDSKFCRTLKCHRHPLPPLRTMIKILQEGVCLNVYS